MSTLQFQPLISTALWGVLLICALVVLAVYAVGSRRRLQRSRWLAVTALMTVALALPLALLLNPTWIEPLPPPAGKPRVTVLIDGSASMATRDGAGGQTRMAEATAIATRLNERLGDAYDVELRTFAATSQKRSLDELRRHVPDGMRSDIATAVAEALRNEGSQRHSILVVSDGIHNAGHESRLLEAAKQAQAMASPLLALAVGGDATVTDLSLEARSAQDLAFVGQKVPVRAVLRGRQLGARTVNVALREGDKVVATREVTLTGDEPATVEFEVAHQNPGVARYLLAADPIEGEVTTANNSAIYVLRIVDEPIRILLLEGKPYWDTKFLTRILAADQAVELVSVVRLAQGRYMWRKLARPPTRPADAAAEPPAAEPTKEAAAAAPTPPAVPPAARSEEWKIIKDVGSLLADKDQLAGFQVVVLGRDAEDYLSDDAITQLRRWIARAGGSLVCFRGPPTARMNQQLTQLMPVRWDPSRESRFRLQLTAAGKNLDWVGAAGGDPLPNLPTLSARFQPTQRQDIAVVWATAQSTGGEAAPGVTSLPLGTGRVVVLEGAGMWRWAFMPPEYESQEHVYAALWHSLTRWLVSNVGLLPTQARALFADKVRFGVDEAATASLLLREEQPGAGPPQVTLHSASLAAPQTAKPAALSDEPGVYRVAFGVLPEGSYQAQIEGAAEGEATARSLFEVRSDVDEVLELKANPALLRRMAEASGGKLLAADSAADAVDEIAAQLTKELPTQFRARPAWDRPWVLVAALGLWGICWALRRQWGLL